MKKRKPPNRASKEPSASVVAAPYKHLITKADGPLPFIVAAPVYDHRSAGIRVLHTLCNELNRCGREAYLLFYQFRPEGGQNFYWSDGTLGYCPEHSSIKRFPTPTSPELLQEIVANGYVVYPEVIQGNPLNAPRVVRYVLANPTTNTYPMLHLEADYIVSFHQSYWPTSNYLLTILLEDPNFNDLDTLPTLQRRMDCTYIGKGSKFGACFKIPGTVLIERVWPADKESLAIMLRNTRYFYTWDLVSETNVNALFCGAIPVVLRWGPYSNEIFLNPQIGMAPYAECHVRDSSLHIDFDFNTFQAERLRYLGGYRDLARGITENVARMAMKVEEHFLSH